MDVKKIRAQLVEMYHRLIPVNTDKDGKVYWNGEDNMYPYEIETVISNSPTAVRASKIFGNYISGKGLTNEEQDIIVNPKKNYKLSRVSYIIGQNYAKQGGAWIKFPNVNAEEVSVQGVDKFIEHLKSNPDDFEFLKQQLV